jgi:hypothetical protein
MSSTSFLSLAIQYARLPFSFTFPSSEEALDPYPDTVVLTSTSPATIFL